jgi:hypothetical protein
MAGLLRATFLEIPTPARCLTGKKGERMKKLFIIIALSTIVFSAWGQAFESGIDNGGTLHTYWLYYQKSNADPEAATKSDVFASSLYTGYVLGVVGLLWEPLEVISIPRGVNNAQIFAVVGKYLDEHPEEWHVGGGLIVFEALTTVWPNERNVKKLGDFLERLHSGTSTD